MVRKTYKFKAWISPLNLKCFLKALESWKYCPKNRKKYSCENCPIDLEPDEECTLDPGLTMAKCGSGGKPIDVTVKI